MPPCVPIPTVNAPALSGGLSVPPFAFETPGGLLCCKFPVAKISTPPINLGVSTGILQAMALVIDVGEAELQAVLDAAVNLLCPFEASPDTL